MSRRSEGDIILYQNIANIASHFFGWKDFVMFDTLLGTSPKNEQYARVPWYALDDEIMCIMLQKMFDNGLEPSLECIPEQPTLNLKSTWKIQIKRPDGFYMDEYHEKIRYLIYNVLVIYLKVIGFEDVAVKFLRDD